MHVFLGPTGPKKHIFTTLHNHSYGLSASCVLHCEAHSKCTRRSVVYALQYPTKGMGAKHVNQFRRVLYAQVPYTVEFERA